MSFRTLAGKLGSSEADVLLRTCVSRGYTVEQLIAMLAEIDNAAALHILMPFGDRHKRFIGMILNLATIVIEVSDEVRTRTSQLVDQINKIKSEATKEQSKEQQKELSLFPSFSQASCAKGTNSPVYPSVASSSLKVAATRADLQLGRYPVAFL